MWLLCPCFCLGADDFDLLLAGGGGGGGDFFMNFLSFLRAWSKVTGFVNAVPDFIGHGKVVDGCSNMLVEVLGDRGKHARSCVGTGSLPAAVSMEMSVRVRD